MMFSKQGILKYLNSNSNNKNLRSYKLYDNYIKTLKKLIFIGLKQHGLDNSKSEQLFNKLINYTNNIEVPFVSYYKVSNIVYDIDITDNQSNEICQLLNFYLRKYIEKHYSSKNTCGYIILIKTIDYVRLSSKQIDFLRNEQETELNKDEKKIKSLDENNSKSLTVSNNLSSQFKALSKTASATQKILDKIKDGMYSKFITILGIFATIIASLFGGLSAVSSAIKSLSSKYSNIVNIMIMSSLFSILLIFIIFFLFACIAHLSGKTLYDEGHVNISATHCLSRLFNKYPLFLISICIFGLLFIMSCLLKIYLRYYFFQ